MNQSDLNALNLFCGTPVVLCMMLLGVILLIRFLRWVFSPARPEHKEQDEQPKHNENEKVDYWSDPTWNQDRREAAPLLAGTHPEILTHRQAMLVADHKASVERFDRRHDGNAARHDEAADRYINDLFGKVGDL